MHQVMMAAAQQNQVFHAGFATIGPVVYVVCVDKVAGSAAWEAATATRHQHACLHNRQMVGNL